MKPKALQHFIHAITDSSQYNVNQYLFNILSITVTEHNQMLSQVSLIYYQTH